jgi:4-amino-4-deoxy-L-arabinose transferase-like glycosyltransferase
MGAGIIAGAGWWILAAEFTPAADRPYFGGSTNNNILQLAIGYNGLGRITGNETGSIGAGNGRGGGGGQGSAFGGVTGILRLFHSEFGGQISWLLPAALISLAAMVWVSRRAARADRTRAAALLWGGWVLVTGLVFSYMNGIIHPYYMVALAPGIAALVGIGATALWQARLGPKKLAGRLAVASGIAAGAVWAYVLLDRTPDWIPWLRWVVVVAGAAAAVLVLAGHRLAGAGRSRRGRLALVGLPIGLALVAGLAGPTAYALDTVNSAHTGAIVSAGPQSAGGGPGGGGGGFPGGKGGVPGAQAGQFGGGTAGTGAPGRTGTPGATGQAGMGQAGTGGTAGPAGPQSGGTSGAGSIPGRTGGLSGRGAGAGGGGGGLGGSTSVSSALAKLLEQDASKYKWVAATEGSEAAAPLELATGDAVMSIGGFNGTDPWPTLAVFKELVANHEIHYYVGQGSQSFGGGQGSSAIAAWVAAHFKKQTVGGGTVYNLTEPLS